ncbi:transcriptional regulator PpsR [Yoonia sp. 2307UL14-13]|uniref:transcriptional regulator PpsR n=1 Tax=Yoonia sp. 2307UL14-13 TaxID=3126506 RepID=UPI0030A173E3
MTSRGTKYWNSGAIPLIAPEILGDIIAEVADLAIVIDETGKILSILVSPTNSAFQKLEHWEKRDIRHVLTIESVSKFDSRLETFLDTPSAARPVELNHTDDSKNWEFPVRYSFHRIGPDGAILMLGRDLRPVAEMQQQLVKAQMALERDYEVQREYDTRFRVLMDSMSEAVVFVSVQTGQMTEVNPAAAALLDQPRERLIGEQFSGCFETRKRGDLIDALASQAMSHHDSVETVRQRGSGRQVTVSPTLFRAAGERVILCRIAASDDTDSQQDDLSRNLRALYLGGPEAIVFTSDAGDVLSTNDAFLGLVDIAHDANVRGRSLSDYLQRGSVDLKVMMENASRAGRMRIYATKIAGEYGSPRPVEVSVTRLHAGTKTVFAFVIRNTNHADTSRNLARPTSDESMRSVVELVGSATLKDIVAETTNVVEKMCIETAVELTMNNRVAAAEMLGLSRQSLYVKLRKFDLLSRDNEEDRGGS